MLKHVTVLLLITSLVAGTAQAQFADVPAGHPAETSVLKLTQLGVLTGFPDGSFRGERMVNRYELALILSRMWDNWSVEQLGDVWNEIVSLETQLAELRGQGERIRRNEVGVQELERTLTGLEERLLALDDRTANIRLTREDVTELETALGTLQNDLRSLQRRLQRDGEAGGQATGQLSGRLEDAIAELRNVGQQVGLQRGELDALRGAVEQLPRDLEAEMDALRDEFLAVAEARAFTSEVGVAAGLLGDNSAYTVFGNFTGQRGRIAAQLSELGLEAETSGRILPGFELGGVYRSTGNEPLGLANAELAATPALRLGATGGIDQGLAFGGYLKHLGDEFGAALPGLDVLVGVSSGSEEDGEFGKLLVQGSAGLAFDGGSYVVRPAALYRRETGEFGVQGFVAELGVGLELSSGLRISAAGRYGLFTPLSGEPARGIPEGELRLDFDSGLNVLIQADAGLPALDKLGTFSEGNPLFADVLEIGVRVGYTIPLPLGTSDPPPDTSAGSSPLESP